MFFDFTWRVVYKEPGQAVVMHQSGTSSTHFGAVTESMDCGLSLASKDFQILQITYSKDKAQ